MSRRIVMFALAATATLITTQAYADRECFENSCRLPAVVEPPPPPVATVEESPAQASGNRFDPVQEPVARRPVAKVVRTIEKQPVRTVENKAPRQPVHSAPVDAKPQPSSVSSPITVAEETHPAPPSIAKPARSPAIERSYASERSTASGALILNIPASYGAEGVAAVQPYAIYNSGHAPRLYVLAPNAKIITIDGND
jgi:hypothetical protein